MHPPLRSLLALALAVAPLTAQVRWQTLAPTTSPSSRAGHGFVAAGPFGMILFGGQDGGSYNNETWSWDGTNWTQLGPSASPGARAHFAMCYDPSRNRVVLFSGWNGNNYPADTWEFDGTTWTRMTPATSPPGRDWAAMEYDAISGKVILYGGHDWQRSTAGLPNYDDTWSWDGAVWTQLQPSNVPPHRWGHRMVVHGAFGPGGAIVMHGGTAGNDTWVWNGTDWNQIPTQNAPPARTRPGIAYDPIRGRAVLWGGVSAGAVVNDVWEFNGADWLQRNAAGGTPPVADTIGVFDPTMLEVVNFGGGLVPNRSSTSASTDAYGPVTRATSRTFGTGCPGTGGVPQIDGSNLAWLNRQYDVGVATGIPGAATSFVVGFSDQRTSTGLPLPFALGAIGMAGCTLYVDPQVVVSTTAGGGGEARLQLTVPGDPGLLGASIFAQALVVSPGSTVLGLVASDAAEHVFGGL